MGKNPLSFWRKKEFRLDLIYAIISGSLLTLLLELGSLFGKITENLGIFISIDITLIGFLFASLAILLVLPENNKIKIIKDHPSYRQIFYYFILTIYILMIGLILAFIDLFFQILIWIFSLIFMIAFLWGLITTIRTVWFLKLFIDLLYSSPNS